ncbi:MAG TPA: hypothetical protein VHE35_08695 [Kofleriaceae bacterium]|nr:hypothetical protein [Kofleriaceae bacterium]
MLRLAVSACVLTLAAGRAAADVPWLDDELREQPPAPAQVLAFEPAQARLTWRVDAAAASTGSGTPMEHAAVGEATVGAEAAVTGEACDFVVVGGQADARTDRDHVALQQWASVCPVSGVVNLELDHRLELAVTPRLLAPPHLRREGTWRETVGVGMSVRTELPGPPDADHRYVALAEAHLAPSFGWVPGHADQLDVGLTADMAFARYHAEPRAGGPGRELRVIDAHVEVVAPATPADRHGYPGGRTAITMDLDVVRAEGWRWAGLRWGAALGVGDAMVTDATGPGDPRLGSVLAGEAGADVERDLGRLTARLDAGRSVWPTYDGQAVVDDHVAASLRGAVARWQGRVELTAARGRLVSAGGLTDADRGGVSADLERALGHGLVARGHAELGKSVYAARATFGEPVWAAEATVSLGLHAGTR